MNADERSETQVIALANHKGGVGKTTTAVNLAAAIARAGHRTLLIDADAQAHATSWFVTEGVPAEGDLYTVVKEAQPIEKAIVSTRIAGLDLLPSSIDRVAALDLELVSMPLREQQISKALEAITSDYEYVLIDLPPSLSLVVINSLTAATAIISPVDASLLGVRGLGAFLGWTRQFAELGLFKGEHLGVLVTKFDMRTNVSRDVLEALREDDELRVFDTVIPMRTSAHAQVGEGLVAGDVGADDDIGRAYLAFAEEVLARTTSLATVGHGR